MKRANRCTSGLTARVGSAKRISVPLSCPSCAACGRCTRRSTCIGTSSRRIFICGVTARRDCSTSGPRAAPPGSHAPAPAPQSPPPAPFLGALLWMLALNAADRPKSVDEILPLFESGRPAPRIGTRPALATVSDEEHVWRPDVLKALEESLEPYVGPMSRALVRKAAQRRTPTQALTELVAPLLPK